METESKEPVKMMVEGMTCSHCALSISRYLEKEGLKEVSVNVGAGEVFFSNPSQTPLEKIKEGIHRLGYKVAEQGSQKKSKWSALEIQFFFCSIFTVLLMLPMIVYLPALHEPMVQLFLALPVLLMGMNYFGRSAWHSLRSGMPNMDVLIAIGSLSAFIYSVGGMILYKDLDARHQHLFFETSATIITLVMLGNIIEHRSVKRTNQSLDELLQLRPEMARQLFIDANGKESIKEIPAKELIKFDTAIVNSGDQVPADGKIISGQAVIDESAMTGESMPAEKITGDEVHAGTIVKSGSLRVKVERVGEETLLSSIIKMVKNANLNKPQIQQVGDKVSAIFVPAVLVISAVTFIVSYFFLHVAFAGSLMRSVAVMVISCPCAMGLATPTAIAVGLGRAAREGILIRGGRAAESFQKINTIVFDKTGTLTTGKFSIADVKYYGMEPAEAKSIIAVMESQSSHPLAKSLHDYFKEGNPGKTKLKSVREEKGIGMHAEDENGNYFSITSHANGLTGEQQQYDIFLLKNGNVIAAVRMMDEIRSDAAETILQLKRLGYELILLSGDKEEKCRKVATALGIEKVFAEQLPDQKAEVIQSLKRKGKVMMVGDGINDAPSLAYADAAISFGNASNIAVNQAGIILLNDKLSDIVKALQMTKHILITVRQNLFWAFFYNVLAIPIAAAGFLSPMIGALSMAFSDVIVIGNSIRLRFKKII